MTHGVKRKMNYTGKLPYQFIETSSALKAVGPALIRAKTLAVDLEADSMYHYQEKVCLIQLATSEMSVIIDPLGLDDISLLKPIFENPKIQKKIGVPLIQYLQRYTYAKRWVGR